MGSQARREEFEDQALVHLDRVFHLALRLTRNRTEAEDLAQETYLRAFKHFDQFDPGTNCRAWLFAILRNAFLNQQKRQGREVPGLDEGELERFATEMADGPGTLESPEEELLKGVAGAELVAALERLPLIFREAVVLADVEECSYKEIAQICGVPMGTVMSRLSRGRRLLRRALETLVREREGLRRLR
ncbi:MAG: ECF subfamily RNA polymerase sigma-24 factor, RNA polymerase sigma-70 factor, ECF subfamily [Candidatus Rokubacteria bacterium CSP1-6]|nr:MAG: ECF subfamily RNA polymerase sigma-24 factor, RNA polymerase sigma-70 factor, ECF subfamily [Candidatus Rokubacteria bacterium CSP1-6]